MNKKQWFIVMNPHYSMRDPISSDSCCDFRKCGIDGTLRAYRRMWINSETDAHFYYKCSDDCRYKSQVEHQSIRHKWQHVKEVNYQMDEIMGEYIEEEV